MKVTNLERYNNHFTLLAKDKPAFEATVESTSKDTMVVKVDDYVQINLSVDKVGKDITKGAVVSIEAHSGDVTLVKAVEKPQVDTTARASSGRTPSVSDLKDLRSGALASKRSDYRL